MSRSRFASCRIDGRNFRLCAAAIATTAFFIVTIRLALAADQVHDEIQVYNADIAEVGQWVYEQQLNYAFVGQTKPEFPGAFVSNHSLQGTPEFAYGVTKWWEAGFYLPFTLDAAGDLLSEGVKARSLFVIPDAAKRSFFYGFNFELGYEMPQFSLTRWELEIRPIIGVRNMEWELIANPIVDVSFGEAGEADFAPAFRLARKLGEDRFIGLEYYADFGRIGDFPPLREQSHQLYAVTDFKLDQVDVELGIGHGFTPGSDGLVVKAIIGYSFPVPGKSNDAESSPGTPLSMGTSSQPRQYRFNQSP